MLMKNPHYVRYTETTHRRQDSQDSEMTQEHSSRELLLGQIALVLLFVIAILLRAMS